MVVQITSSNDLILLIERDKSIGGREFHRRGRRHLYDWLSRNELQADNLYKLPRLCKMSIGRAESE